MAASDLDAIHRVNDRRHRKKPLLVIASQRPSFVLFDKPNAGVNRRQVIVEHPTEPNRGIIVRLSIHVVMPNAEVVRKIEQVARVF